MSSSALSDSLRLELEVPPEARAGEPVPVTIRVRNVAARPVQLHLMGRTVAFDIVVARAEDGAVVWRRLEGQAVPAILQLRTLAPDEVLELRDRWDQRTNAGARVPPGFYTVRGVVPTDEPRPLETPVARLRILP